METQHHFQNGDNHVFVDHRKAAEEPLLHPYLTALADGDLDKAVKLTCESDWRHPFPPQVFRFVAYHQIGDQTRAHRALELAQQRVGNQRQRAQLLGNWALWSLSNHHYNQAIEYADKSILINPRCSVAWINKLCALSLKEDVRQVFYTLRGLNQSYRGFRQDAFLIEALHEDPQLEFMRAMVAQVPAITLNGQTPTEGTNHA